ncbi:hypothetical protein ACP4OV_005123 [Aristida adscensionis]
MPKRPSDKRGGGRSAKLPTGARRRRHLYLVLDDWELGYTIRKIDLSSDTDSGDAKEPPHHQAEEEEEEEDRAEQRLPPAVFRLEAPRAHSGLFAAFGTKIMATHHSRNCNSSPMFDVRTRALTFAPRQEYRPNSYCNVYVQVDGKLFFLDASGNFEMLPPPPPPHNGVPVPPPPFDASFPKFRHDWSWRELPESPPLFHIVAHAVHPNERTIFFVLEDHSSRRGAKVATFSFDTGSSRWTRHGRWRLPFKGRGFADEELDAWVGLPHDPDALGHLCACDFVSADADNIGRQPPAFKLSKEKLFCVDPAEEHIGATLVQIGGGSRFCLVQCLSVDGREEGVWKEAQPELRRFLLRLTTFSLRYDKKGDLRASKRHLVGSYRLPKIATEYWDELQRPVAFWM